MKCRHSYRTHRLELFPQKQHDRTWLCCIQVDGDWINHDYSSGVIDGERGPTRAEAVRKALEAGKANIDLCTWLNGH